MNTNGLHQLDARSTELSARAIDESMIATTHARLLGRLEAGEGITWQEVIDAPLDTVWEAAGSSPSAFFRHLPGVTDIRMLHGSTRPRFVIDRDLAGVIDTRIGELLISVDSAMICASDLDASDVSCAGMLPTIYSLSMHDHPSRRASSVLVFAGVTLGVHNPWLMQAFSNHCRSIRETLQTSDARSVQAVRFAFGDSKDRLALGGARLR